MHTEYPIATRWWETGAYEILRSTSSIEEIVQIYSIVPQATRYTFLDALSQRSKSDLDNLFIALCQKLQITRFFPANIAAAIDDLLHIKEPEILSSHSLAVAKIREEATFLDDSVSRQLKRIPTLFWTRDALGYASQPIQKFLEWLQNLGPAVLAANPPPDILVMNPFTQSLVHPETSSLDGAMAFLHGPLRNIFRVELTQKDVPNPAAILREVLDKMDILHFRLWRLYSATTSADWTRLSRDFTLFDHCKSRSVQAYVNFKTLRDNELLRGLRINDVEKNTPEFIHVLRDIDHTVEDVVEIVAIRREMLSVVLNIVQLLDDVDNVHSHMSFLLGLETLGINHKNEPELARSAGITQATAGRAYRRLVLSRTAALPWFMPFANNNVMHRPPRLVLGHGFLQIANYKIKTLEYEKPQAGVGPRFSSGDPERHNRMQISTNPNVQELDNKCTSVFEDGEILEAGTRSNVSPEDSEGRNRVQNLQGRAQQLKKKISRTLLLTRKTQT